jgi:hypothetical protein
MRVSHLDYENHEAINTIKKTIKKITYYKDRLTCNDTNTINNIIENRVKTGKCMENKNRKTISKWDIRTKE